MIGSSKRARATAELVQKPVAIIDIGSNSIRLVVYDGRSRTPVPLFNEKVVSALGAGMGATGRLNAEGAASAVAAVGRFVRLARIMEVEALEVLATAAVRDASDGQDFVDELERRYGITVQICSGGEEAELAALGVLCSTPDADGIVADLGGGSLELVDVADRCCGQHVTMPLGVLRLSEASGGARDVAAKLIDEHLSKVDWVAAGKGRSLYAVGGAWRSIARICIAQTSHPLLVLDNFTLPATEALSLIDLISRQSTKSLQKIPGVSKKRLANMPIAALLLEKVLEAVKPAELVFSVYGMREGKFFQQLPPELQAEDPLIGSCVRMARTAGRFPEHGEEILDWMSPLFRGETLAQRRLRYAACLISDIFWDEHPDYRAEQAFLRTLRLPFMGLNHTDRAFLALAVYIRYQGDEEAPHAMRAKTLLDDVAVKRARIMGLALRMGHAVSGGAPGLLGRTKLMIERDILVLEVDGNDAAFSADIPDKSDKLAKAIGCTGMSLRRGYL